jgi:hypothetical protein
MATRWFRLGSAVFVSIWLLRATAALAADTTSGARVVIVRPANSLPVMVETLVRLKGELTSAGFETEIVAAPAGAADRSLNGLERLAAQRKAHAVVAIIGDLAPDSVEVWVIDQVTGKSVVRRMPFEPSAPQASKTLALRAIELLRASFLEIELSVPSRLPAPPQQHEPPPALPPSIVRFVEMERPSRPPPRFGVQVGGVAVINMDRLGPALLPLARFDWSLRSRLVAQVTLAGLGTRPAVDSPVGSAEVQQSFGLLGGTFFFRSDVHLRPFVEMAAGFLQTSVEGRADTPNRSRAAGQWSALGDVGVGAVLRLPDRFYLTFGIHAQLAEPYPAVRFLGTVVATTARPNLLLTLSVGAWL